MRRSLLPSIVWAIVVGCTSSAPPPGASVTTAVAGKPAITEQTRGEIQALLQKQNTAMASKDQATYDTTVDQGRRALVRCANESFDLATRQGTGAVKQVSKIQPYLDTYVLAYVQEGSLGMRRIFFRKTADGRWMQSEPTDDEVGGVKKTTIEDIQIEYWGVDDDLVAALGKASVVAKQVVLANLLSDNRRDALAVRFYPTRALTAIQGCSTAGYHVENAAIDPAIRMLSYWITPSGELSPFTVSVMSHEWLHCGPGSIQPGDRCTASLVAEGGLARLRRSRVPIAGVPNHMADAQAARGRG
jgi:hypothetical protein